MCSAYLNANTLLFAECDLAATDARLPSPADVEVICGSRETLGDVSDPADYRKCGASARVFVLTHEPRTLNPDEAGVRIYEYVGYCAARFVRSGDCSAEVGADRHMVVVDMFGIKPEMRRSGVGKAFWARVEEELSDPAWHRQCLPTGAVAAPVLTLQALYSHTDYLSLLAKHSAERVSRRQTRRCAVVDLDAIAADLVRGSGSCAFWRAVGFDKARFDLRPALCSSIVCPLLVMWKSAPMYLTSTV